MLCSDQPDAAWGDVFYCFINYIPVNYVGGLRKKGPVSRILTVDFVSGFPDMSCERHTLQLLVGVCPHEISPQFSAKASCKIEKPGYWSAPTHATFVPGPWSSPGCGSVVCLGCWLAVTLSCAGAQIQHASRHWATAQRWVSLAPKVKWLQSQWTVDMQFVCYLSMTLFSLCV